jgi:HK97 family phage portal protein
MGLVDRVTSAMALAPWDHPQRVLSSPIEDQLKLPIRTLQAAERPWRPSSVREALGVPAFHQAVTLIANTMGTFSLNAYQNGRLVPNDQRPRLIVRPNPFTTMREYLREVGWSMATRGEAWQWVTARDTDGLAIGLIPVPSREVKAEGKDWLKPQILWRGADKTGDMVPTFLSKELGTMRGFGPLQYCGAAISAAVESQEWAANFFAVGGHPSVHFHSEVELVGDEAADLRAAWVNTPPNMPQVTSGPITVEELAANESAGQMLESRNWNAGEGARMFGIPGPLLEYSRGGSSLTYQNVATLFDQFLRQCLIPNYLEPLEQVLTDLLPRNWACRFNVDAILRADIKTRFEVYESGVAKSGVLSVEEARIMEGLAPGSVETAPVPFSPPAAMPPSLPNRLFGGEWRCDSCHRKLAEVRGEGTSLRCRCGTLAVA